MGLLATINRALHADSDSRYPGPIDDFWYHDVGEYGSDSGIRVTEQGAMNISTVWKCVHWRFKMFGSLPKKVYERSTVLGKPAQIEAPNHPLFSLIKNAPQPGMTSFYWFGLISADLHLWGNSYAAIVRDPQTGRIDALVRITPNKCKPVIKSVIPGGQKKLWYEVTGDNGLPVNFYPEEILHIRGLGFDGLQGYSPIRIQMNLLGWNRATTRYGAQFFKNASRPSGIISPPLGGVIKPEKKQGIIDALSASGKSAGKLVLVEGAVNYTKMTMDQDEAQFIETCQMQEDDIAGMMEVKPHEIGILRHATNNNIEQETISSVTRNLQPFAENVEQWLELQLLSDMPSTGRGGGTERDRYFIECEFKSLLKGDTAAQTAHIIAMRDRGIYSCDDCADYLGLPPFEGGDVRVINAAYVPLDMLQELAKARAKSTPPGAPNAEGGPVPAENKQSASVASMFGGLMRDGVGRTIARKKDRQKSVDGIFRPILTGVAEAMNVTDFDFEDYLGAMAKRSPDWLETRADAIAEEELTRLVAALLEKL